MAAMKDAMPVNEPIALLDLTRALKKTPALRSQLVEAFLSVVDSGQYILGPQVQAFENQIAKLVETQHAVGVSSGTDALLIALMAQGLGPGDEVLCPSYTFFATAGSVARVGATPVWVDICPGCFCMLPAHAAHKVTPKTRAMLPVHLFGQTAAMQSLLDLAQTHNLAIIEDAAQAMGATYQGRPAGSLGHMGCFSFFPTKNLGGFGDAGLVTTDDASLAESLRMLRVHGSQPKYHHHKLGGNFRIDTLQAALLSVQLQHLTALREARQKHAALYHALLSQSGLVAPEACICTLEAGGMHPNPSAAPLALPEAQPGRTHTYNQYVVRIRHGNRDKIRQALFAQQIATEIYYPIPLHLQPCFAAYHNPKEALQHSQTLAAQSLALPIYPELRVDEIERIATALIALCRNPPS